MTIFFNPTHTVMRIGNRFFGTSGSAWVPVNCRRETVR